MNDLSSGLVSALLLSSMWGGQFSLTVLNPRLMKLKVTSEQMQGFMVRSAQSHISLQGSGSISKAELGSGNF